MSVGKDFDFATMTRDEKIASLAELYEEGREEFAQLYEGMGMMVKALQTMKMPEEQIWATIVVSTADALGLDLDSTDGMTTAAVLAGYQVGLGA